MMQIRSNVAAMTAARVLDSNNRNQQLAIMRLGTGLRINSGKDDPAGLIASELLRSEKTAISAAINNIMRADNVVATAEGGLDEISRLLLDLEDLIDASANEDGISVDERQANQLEIDEILDSINRIASTTEFQGRKLLNGELEYLTSGISTNFTDVAINSAKLPHNGFRTVNVEVTASAQVGTLLYAGSATAAGTTTIEVAGNLGTETLSFSSGTGIASVITAINQSAHLTGVSAASNAGQLEFYSTDYGSSQFVSVQAIEGTFNVTGGSAGNKDFGRDATVTINGTQATTDGLTARLKTATLGIQIELDTTFGTTLGTDQFDIVGGGANFMITPTVGYAGKVSLGIQSLTTSNLGTHSTGFLSSLASGQTNAMASGNYITGQSIVRSAVKQVAELRGRIGAFQKDTLDTTRSGLQTTLENITAAESNIRDTDFAETSSLLTRSQVLVQSATQVLRIATQTPQQALALLA